MHYNAELLERATRYWLISGSALPPTLDEVLYRDTEWDDEVYRFRQIVDYLKDYPKMKEEGLI